MMLTKSPGLSLALEQRQHVALSDRALHVSDQTTAALVQELDLHLGTLTGRTGTAENARDTGKRDLIHLRLSAGGGDWWRLEVIG